ncbi:MAG: signal transduction protein [Syntrophus sp. (in: bacteria)]|nr:signal transduction protein [Syntrophus sp. (in: bacteria)]
MSREESLFFARVKDVYKKGSYTCDFDITVFNAALLMQHEDISGIIVVNRDRIVGVLTDKDLRNKVLACGLDPTRTRISSIMSTPVITVNEEDFLSEAIYKMMKNQIHRLAVVGEGGGLVGILSDTDIIRFHTDSALFFIKDLEGARCIDDIKLINDKMFEYVAELFKSDIKPKEIIRLISYLNDLIITKVIKLLIEGEFAGLPKKDFAFLVLGSEGRMEQTLKTDQDNAIVYRDDLSEKDVSLIEKFSVRLIDSMVDIGFPSCPGGIMAKNVLWRRSLHNWISTVKEWVRVPTPDNILSYSMFSDLRTVYGDRELEKGLKDRIINVIGQHPVFLAHMANNILRFKPPLNFLGGFKTEKKGQNAGKLDIKLMGIFPITEGVKILALEAGLMDGGTSEKIRKLMSKDIVPDDSLYEVEASLDFFIYVRLKSQIRRFSMGKEPTNYIDPLELSEVERERLKVGFSMVKSFQSFLADHYKVSSLAG